MLRPAVGVGAASVCDTLRERRDGVPPTVGDRTQAALFASSFLTSRDA
ncbi:hypothetical protein [Anabaena sp. UHCC 0399]|nr:hypothetical protein [Anabaena sp. UHCC 0399]MEA5568871.1 hypothetical protein [Anabaena sp. UHCC 0399]